MTESERPHRLAYWGGLALYILLVVLLILVLGRALAPWIFYFGVYGGLLYLGIGECRFWIRRVKRESAWGQVRISIIITLQTAVGIPGWWGGFAGLIGSFMGFLLSFTGALSGIVLVGWLLIPSGKRVSLRLSPAALVLYLGLAANVLFAKWCYDHYYGEDFTRSRVARTKTELRDLAVALETYFMDHGSYPPPCTEKGLYKPARIDPETGKPDYAVGVGGYISVALTTPMSYVPVLPIDPCAPNKEPYLYATNFKICWIMIGRGPDRVFNPNFEDYPTVGPPPCGNCQWRQFLSQFGAGAFIEYDPTNGSNSAGDIISVGP